MPEARLFCPHLQLGTVILSPEESRHAVASLRCRRGDAITLFDGQGREAVGHIASASARKLTAEIESIVERAFGFAYRLTLAVALGKAHRQSYLVEKCTELGVSALWPMLTERSVTRPRDAAVEKWSRRCIEAAKQSGRAWVPGVETPQPLAEVLARAGEFEAIFLADPSPAATALARELGRVPSGGRVLALIGPEGGWTEGEREAAVSAGARAVSISPTVLRVETAAVAICAAVAMNSVPP
jgi:16S rRNA (uracil1498-N3)-methyltransferase